MNLRNIKSNGRNSPLGKVNKLLGYFCIIEIGVLRKVRFFAKGRSRRIIQVVITAKVVAIENLENGFAAIATEVMLLENNAFIAVVTAMKALYIFLFLYCNHL